MANTDWTVFPVLALFITVSYIILRFLQRRSRPSSSHSSVYDSGWDPGRCLDFIQDNNFREDFYRLKKEGAPPNVLGPVLLRRTMANIGYLMEIQSKRQTIQSLVQSGSLSEEIWLAFLEGERFMNEEMQAIIEEAETVKTGWGQIIVRQAHELLQAEMARQLESQQIEADKATKMKAESELRQRELT